VNSVQRTQGRPDRLSADERHCHRVLVPVRRAAAEQSLKVGVLNVRSLGNKSTGRRARHHRRPCDRLVRRRQLAARLGRVAERHHRHTATMLRRQTYVLDREPLQPA